MDNYWIIVDASNIAYRSWSVLGNLRNEGAATGVIYGVATQLQAMTALYGSELLVVCFDGGCMSREELYPAYKANRKEKRAAETDKEKLARRELGEQLKKLRTEHLPNVGLKNILWEPGYEGDDMIASAARAVPRDEAGVIISADEDMWQLLRPGLKWWSPTTEKTMTAQKFQLEWGMEPGDWAKVKAWAGCSGDNVAGLEGVGNKTAAKYLRGEKIPDKLLPLFETHKEVYERNIRLVTLPMETAPPAILNTNQDILDWDCMYRAIGAKTREKKSQGTKPVFGFGFGAGGPSQFGPKPPGAKTG